MSKIASQSPQCAIDGCSKQPRTMGMCGMHYERLRRHGDLNHRSSLALDLTGKKYGRLTAVARAPNGNHGMVKWECICECGSRVSVQSGNLRTGHTVSCGCLRIERGARTTHGMAKTPTYRSWIAMRRRCRDASYAEYHLYGGRGITVCSQWVDSFETFLADMGERPAGKTLDRIMSSGNYEPDNCRWATPVEQANNRRPRGGNL